MASFGELMADPPGVRCRTGDRRSYFGGSMRSVGGEDSARPVFQPSNGAITQESKLFEHEGGEVQSLLDTVRERYGVRSLTFGHCADRTGRYTGAKISFEHVSSIEHLSWLGIKVSEIKPRG